MAATAVLAPSLPTRADSSTDTLVVDKVATASNEAPSAADDPPRETNVASLSAAAGDPAPATVLVPEIRRELEVRPGDTMGKIMAKAGIPRRQAYAAIVAMKSVYDPRIILPGQRITVTYNMGISADDGTERVLLQSVYLAASLERRVSVRRDGNDGFTATEIIPKLEVRQFRVGGAIRNSLYKAGILARLSPPVLVDLIRIFSWDVDFQRDIRPGDSFDVAFERYYTPEGIAVRDGKIVYAALTLSGERRALYRYEYASGRTDYFDEDGRSARKALLRTPIDGARLASRYGRRRHPILGYTRMHRGVDFAAARGTPIFAAGDGRIVRRGRKGAYGNYIRIRHNATYSTAYGHMSRYRRGLTVGSRVKQRQIIGYVGSTGLSTGPHLHFEIIANGRPTNPFRLRMPSGRRLKGRRLAEFKTAREAAWKRIASLAPPEFRISSR